MNKSNKKEKKIDIIFLRDLLKTKESEFKKTYQDITFLKAKSSELKGQIDLINHLICQFTTTETHQ